MKKFISICALLLAVANVAVVGAAEQLIVAGHANPNVSIVDMRSSDIIWQYKLNAGEACNSINLLEGDSLMLFSTQTGARILSFDKRIVWEYKVKADSHTEVHSAKPLKNGGFVLFVSGAPAQVLEFSADYELVGRTEFDGVSPSPHSQFRQGQVAKSGNWLLSLFAKKAVVEMTREGEIVEEHNIGGTAFSFCTTRKGTWMLGMGDGHAIVEYDPETKSVVRKFTKIDGVTLLYVSQIQQISRKSYLVANWSGHNKKKLSVPAPQLFEISSDGELLWSWDDKQNLGKISAYCYSRKGFKALK